MPLPPPELRTAHGVLRFPDIVSRDPTRDEAFIDAVKAEFPNTLNRQFLPVEAPPAAPHLTLTDTSAQLLFSAVQADVQVRPFEGNSGDLEVGLSFVERKLQAALLGLQTVDITPTSVGLITTINFPFPKDGTPAKHVLDTHLKAEVDSGNLQDASARIALRIRDTYFVTLVVANYEVRTIERVLPPGPHAIQFRPGEGQIDEIGLELNIDINNNLEAQTSDKEPRVTQEGVQAVVRLLREIASSTGPEFVSTGKVSVATLTESAATPA